MVVNFRAREISKGTRKLARTPTLIKKKVIHIKIRILKILLSATWFDFLAL
jgi:hypothetical protein